MSQLVPNRWFIQVAVFAMTCIVPIPPSHALIVDCQPLSCHATAYKRRAGILMSGNDAQNWRRDATSSASRTCCLGAGAPRYEGVHELDGGGGGGGGGSLVSFGGASERVGRGRGLALRVGDGAACVV